jgi:SAM-dependent methyltransferase
VAADPWAARGGISHGRIVAEGARDARRTCARPRERISEPASAIYTQFYELLRCRRWTDETGVTLLYENPDLYDALLPVSQEHLNFYDQLARSRRGAILELACGSGQIIVPIADGSRRAVGLDNSPQMLEGARRRGAAANAPVEFVEGDMRTFDLGERFSMIFIARNSLLHLSEPADFTALFSAVRRHLADGGVFAFDVFNPLLRALAREAGERYPVMRVSSPSHGELTVEATNDYDAATQVNRATWYVSTATQQDAWVSPLHLRSIFPQELLSLLSANHFRLVRRDGDFRGGEFIGTSPLQVCQCCPA